ncbi:MAG: SGNH/GDSL hydrolase family protein [Anaerolineae bacterium]|nr:SGNH/GDSL hydrolase family protein [Anaerolineae bacterium]
MKKNHLAVLSFSALLALLAGSLLLNWLFFRQGKAYYLELNATRLDPWGSDFYADGVTSVNSGVARVVFFGDSRAYAWPPLEGLRQFEFVNRGVGAQTTAQISARFQEDVAGLSPAIIIIQMGINDLKAIPLFPERRDAIIAECEANIEATVRASRELGAQVILTTIFPLGDVPLERRLFWSPDVKTGIETVNDYIRSSEGKGVIILDAAAVLADEQEQVREEYSVDLLHVSPAGYKALNEELEHVLAELGQAAYGVD